LRLSRIWRDVESYWAAWSLVWLLSLSWWEVLVALGWSGHGIGPGVRVVNLTSHGVTVWRRGWWGLRWPVLRVAPSGVVARVDRDRCGESALRVAGGAVVERVLLSSQSNIVGVPEVSPGVVLVVSRVVAEELGSRADVVFPLGAVRGVFGRVVGCWSFGSIGSVPENELAPDGRERV